MLPMQEVNWWSSIYSANRISPTEQRFLVRQTLFVKCIVIPPPHAILPNPPSRRRSASLFSADKASDDEYSTAMRLSRNHCKLAIYAFATR